MATAIVSAGGLLALAMMAAWMIQRRTGNSGWIDTIWSLSVGAASLLALAMAPGDPQRRTLLAVLIGCWSLRLGGHILKRTRKAADDPRYAALMAQWGRAAGVRLFLFLQMQAIAGLVLVAAVSLAATSQASVAGWGSLAFAGLALAAIAAEALADAQLAASKKHGAPGGICDTGLWAYSRHPNYVAEWTFWAAIAGLAIAPPNPVSGLFALAAPAMMYVLLRFGSGAPHVEAHLQRTRPDAFADYARRVPVFFPTFRR